MKLNKENFKNDYLKITTYDLVTMALLVAMEIILSRFLSIQGPSFRIGFSFVALAMAGMLLGPVKAGLVGFTADILGLFLFSGYTFNPGITFTTTCVGVVFGIFLFKTPDRIRIISCVLIHQLILSLGLNSLWLGLMYGTDYIAMMVSRIPQTMIYLPVEILVLMALCNQRVYGLLKNLGRA